MKTYPIEHPLKELGKNNVVKQDNTSTIKMVKGGVRLCGTRTRNIHIFYFYVTERLKDGTIVVTYYTTKEMVADYLSKLLQGSLCCLHRNTLRGITPELVDQYQMEYASVNIARAELPNDYLSS